MKPSTKSKPSTASDTATKNNSDLRRWVRIRAPQSELFEVNTLLDLYWGGSERRVTGLTLRIIAVNAIALLILMFGIIYLGQYQNRLIETRLSTFETELSLVADALSESISTNKDTKRIDYKLSKSVAARLSQSLKQNLYFFDSEGSLIARSDYSPPHQKRALQSVEVLKTIARTLLDLLPGRDILPQYQDPNSAHAKDYPDAADALKGQISLSAWQGHESRIFLSAATPLFKAKENRILGAILMTREATDIEQDVIQVWIDILRIFAVTLILTVLLSIYLSGVIARPLKKLARAAEAVRKGKATADDIPDLSARNDEIGELSLVLKQMTHALWDRMDATENFAADVAHELKNPLTSLKSAIETLQIVKNEADRKKLLAVIIHDIDRLDRLITDISHASRLDSELSREVFEAFSLKKTMHTLMNIYLQPLERPNSTADTWDITTTAGHTKITVSCSIRADIKILGIENRIIQVFQNLLSNALSFSPKSGGEIFIHITNLKDRASIIFEDRGPGIPENKRESIFERFYSERPNNEDYGRHSGLGLSICKQIIEAHKGEIIAENAKSASGEILGARFTVILNKA